MELTSTELERVAKRFDPGCELVRYWGLEGGVSAQVVALELRGRTGELQTVVLRRHSPVDLKRNPDVATLERDILEVVKKHGVPAPQVFALDTSCEVLPTPYLLVELIDGQSKFELSNKDLQQLASNLVKIHRVDTSSLNLPDMAERLDRVLDSAVKAGNLRSRDADLARQRLGGNPDTLLHGDFWPGNVLWAEGEVAAVIDWEDAALGDLLSDVANLRLELLWFCGEAAMGSFTDFYKELNPLDERSLSSWDLFSALAAAPLIGTWGLTAEKEHEYRGKLHHFAKAALLDLGSPSVSRD